MVYSLQTGSNWMSFIDCVAPRNGWWNGMDEHCDWELLTPIHIVWAEWLGPSAANDNASYWHSSCRHYECIPILLDAWLGYEHTGPVWQTIKKAQIWRQPNRPQRVNCTKTQRCSQPSTDTAQKLYEHHANSWCQPAPEYKIGNKVWLDLWNVQMDRPSKKLNWQYSKFTVLKKVGSHTYHLNTLAEVHPVFHMWLLWPVNDNPLPSQTQTDWQPPAIIGENGDKEYKVEEIVAKWMNKCGWTKYHIQWCGWHNLTWEPATHLEDTIALDIWKCTCMNTINIDHTDKEGGIVRG